MFFGGMIAGQDGIMMAFIFALAINFISYWNSDKKIIKCRCLKFI
jgi:heat shock protein HtpX